MTHTLPELQYAKDALAPHISAETFEYHHGKHHATYVAKLNELVEGTEFADWSVEDLIVKIDQVSQDVRKPVFNNAAQHFNHSFYWQSLAAPGKAEPGQALLDAIGATFGDLDTFKAKFTNECVTHFGSGWGWLVRKQDGSLAITSTHDAGCPLTDGDTPLLTCDVWEHAYYVDYRNARPKYLENFWHVVNWDFVARNLGG